MPERDYSHRSAVDKLGIKEGSVVALDERAGALDTELLAQIEQRAAEVSSLLEGRPDVVLITADASTDAVSVLRHWRGRIVPNGGIWLLTPKRGQPGYVNQTELIPAGLEAGLVDNKTCSVSETVSGMRFVIRKRDR